MSDDSTATTDTAGPAAATGATGSPGGTAAPGPGKGLSRRAGGIRALARRAPAALACLWALAMLLAAPVQAQSGEALNPVTLVKNTHLLNGVERSYYRQAQSFTTGDGYHRLERVYFGFSRFRHSLLLNAESETVLVSLRRDSGGEPGGYVVRAFGRVTPGDAHTFWVPLSALLEPRTTYWVEVNRTDAGAFKNLTGTVPSGGEQGLPGWTIGNGRLVWCESGDVIEEVEEARRPSVVEFPHLDDYDFSTPEGRAAYAMALERYDEYQAALAEYEEYEEYLEALAGTRGFFCTRTGRFERDTPLEMRLEGRPASQTRLRSLTLEADGQRLRLQPGFDSDRLAYEADSGLAGQVTVTAEAEIGTSTVSIANDDDPVTPGTATLDLAGWPRTNPTHVRVTVTDQGGQSRTYRVTVRNGKLDYTHINRANFWERDYAAGYLAGFWARAHVPRVSQGFRTGSDAAAYEFEGVDIKLDSTGVVKVHLYNDRGGRPYRSLGELQPLGSLAGGVNGTVRFRARQRMGQYPLLEPDTTYHVMFTLDQSGGRNGQGGVISLDLADPGENDTAFSEAGFRLHDGSLSYILESQFNEVGDTTIDTVPPETDPRAGDFGLANCDSDGGYITVHVPKYRFRNLEQVRRWMRFSPMFGRNLENYDIVEQPNSRDIGADLKEYVSQISIPIGGIPVLASCTAAAGEYGDDWRDAHSESIRAAIVIFGRRAELDPGDEGYVSPEEVEEVERRMAAMIGAPGTNYGVRPTRATGFPVRYGWNSMDRQLRMRIVGTPVTGNMPAFNLPLLPERTEVSASGTELDMHFDVPIEGSGDRAPLGFQFTVSAKPDGLQERLIQVTGVEVSAEDRRVRLALGSTVYAGETVEVAHDAPPEAADDRALQTPSGLNAGDFEVTAENGSTQADPRPVPQSASVPAAGTTLDILFDRAVHGSPDPGQFTVRTRHHEVPVSGVSVSSANRRVRLTLGLTVYEGQRLTVDWLDPFPTNDANVIETSGGEDAAGFTGLAVTNGSEQASPAAPIPVAAEVIRQGTWLSIDFHRPLTRSDTYDQRPPLSAFQVVSGSANAVTRFRFDDDARRVWLKLSERVGVSTAVTASYTPPGDAGRRMLSAEGVEVPAFTFTGVINNSARDFGGGRPVLLRAYHPRDATDSVDRRYVALEFGRAMDRSATALGGLIGQIDLDLTGSSFNINRRPIAVGNAAIAGRSFPRSDRLVYVHTHNQPSFPGGTRFRYTDPSAGDDTTGLLQDTAGRDAGSFFVPGVGDAPSLGSSRPRMANAFFVDGGLIKVRFDREIDRRSSVLKDVKDRFQLRYVDGQSFAIGPSSVLLEANVDPITDLGVFTNEKELLLRLPLNVSPTAIDVLLVYTPRDADSDSGVIQALNGVDAAGTTLHLSPPPGIDGQQSRASRASGFLTASFGDVPPGHGGEPFGLRLEFSRAVDVDEAKLRAALEVTGGAVTGLHAAYDPDGPPGEVRAWELALAPDASAEMMTVRLSPARDCKAKGAFCTRDGLTIAEAAEAEVPGVVPTFVTSVGITSTPGPNGAWDTGEAVVVEVGFNREVQLYGPPGAAQPTVGILLGGERREAAYEHGSTTKVLRFRHVVEVRDHGARTVGVVADSLDPGGVLLVDNLGQEARTEFTPPPASAPPPRVVVARSVAENVGPGTAVGAPVTAVDPDGDTLTYALYNDDGTPATDFAIDAATGQIVTVEGVHYDYELRHAWDLVVVADDGNGNHAEIGVRLELTDVDETLTFAFEDAPEAHGGGNFTFRARFSEPVMTTWTEMLKHVFEVTNGRVVRATRLDLERDLTRSGVLLSALWEIEIFPQPGDVTVTLPATTDCGAEGSVCTLDGRGVEASARLTVAAGTLTAEMGDHPQTHDRSPFYVEVRFNLAPDVTAESLRDHAFTVTNGEVTKAEKEDWLGKEWRIRVLPHSNGPVRVELPAATDCGAPGAVCTVGGAGLSNALVWEIEPADPDAVDGTAPEPESAEVRLAELAVVFGEGLDESLVPPAPAFAVTVGGAARALAGTDPVRVSGRRAYLALAAPVKDGEAVTVSYAPPEDAEAARLRDVAGNAAAAFEGLEAENATPRLTARFADVPQTHDGVHNFRFRLVFSEPPAPGLAAGDILDRLSTRIGDKPASRPRLVRQDPEGREWRVVMPFRSSDWRWAGDPLTIEMAPTGRCDEAGAICTADGRRHRDRVRATVRGAPSLTARDAEAAEGTDAALSFTVRLSTAQEEAVTVDYATLDGTAVADEDYTSVSGTLTFPPGETGLTVDVAVLDDAAVEADEDLTLTLSNPSGAGVVVRRAEATGTIASDDVALFTAAFSDLPERHSGDSFNVRITFSEAPKAGVDADALLAALRVTGGEATAAIAFPGDGRRWRVTVAPEVADDGVMLRLPAPGDCDAESALCTADGRALAEDATAWVSGSQAVRVTSARIASDAGENGTWDEGETVEAALVFSAPVTVDGTPGLGVLLDGVRRQAVYSSGSGTATLTFSYTVTAADDGARKARVAPDGLVLAGASITDAGGQSVLTVFRTAPWVTAAAFLADASADGTWSGGEALEVRLSFSEAVTVTGGLPGIDVNLHGNPTELVYASGTGTDALTFSMDILAGSVAGSAIELPAGSISLNGAVIVAETGGLAAETGFPGADTADALDEVPPALSAAVVTESLLVLTFGERLDRESVPAPSAFTVTVAGAARALAETDPVTLRGRRASLALSSPVAPGEAVTLGYAPPAGEGAAPLRDRSGNPAAAFETEVDNDTVAFTMQFTGAPASHGGQSFTLGLSFSEAPDIQHWVWPNHLGEGGTLRVAHGAVTGPRRLAGTGDLQWEVTIEPAGTEDVTVTLPVAADCDAIDAVCNADGKPLSAAASVTVPHAAPGEQPVQDAPFTVRLAGVPAEHDGAGAAVFEVHFSEEPQGYSFRTLRDETLEILQDGTRITPRVNRKDKPSSRTWTVTVEPASKADITVAIAATADCADAGAVCNGDGEPLSNGVSATIPGPPSLSVADATVEEAAGATLDFAVTLGRASTATVTVDYATSDGTASAGDDYTSTSGTLSFAPGETAKTVSVPVLDDAHDEGSETLTLTLSNPSGGNAWLADASATGTIENSDAMPGAWLARFGRTAAEQAMDAVRGRLSADRSPGIRGRFAGQPLSDPSARFGDPQEDGTDGTVTGDGARSLPVSAAEDRRAFLALTADGDEGEHGYRTWSLTPQEVLLGTSFTMQQDGEGGVSAGFWGGAARSGFSGRVGGPDGETTLDGELTGVMLGADRKRKGDLIGLMLFTNRGEGTYYGDPAVSGAIEADLTGLVPYADRKIGEGLSVWGAAGIGEGGMTLTPEGKDPMVAGIDWTMAAVGAEGTPATVGLLGGAQAGWHADALWTRTTSDAVTGEAEHPGTGNLAASTSETTRLRLGLKAAWERMLDSGVTIGPRLEIGLRHDGGDAETGFGLEVGGGARFEDPGRDLSVSLDGRTLAVHEDGSFDSWGLDLGVAWDPRPETRRGWSARAGGRLGGASSGGVDALLGPEAFPGLGDAGGGGNWSLEVARGAARGRGMVGSPYARTGGGDDLRLGYRIEPDTAHAANARVDFWSGTGSGGGGGVWMELQWRW